MSNVLFQFEGGGEKAVSANPGDNLLNVARGANVAIDAPCSGNGACGKCRVKLVAGELESFPTSHISQAEFAEGWRLACMSKVQGDVTVMVPDIASAYQSRMKTADLSSGKEIAIFEALQQEIRDAGIEIGNPYFSTDTAAVLRAAEIDADVILLAKNVDGVYSADPVKDPTAVKYDSISYDEVLAQHLMVMDTTATSLSMDNHIPVLLFALKDPENIIRALCGENVGTIVKE